MPVIKKKGGSSTGPPTYASRLEIKRKYYIGEINTDEFGKHLGQAHQFSNKINKEGEEKP